MRILFDQGVPAPLRHVLSGHEVSTAYEMQWAELSNGLLLNEANAAFDILITTDQGLRFQQNLASFSLGVVVIRTPRLRLQTLLTVIEELRAAIQDVKPGELVIIEVKSPS